SDGDDRLLARLVNGMVSFWEVRSRTEARQAYLPLAVAAAQRVATASDARDDHLQVARLELAYGSLLQMLGDLPGARRLIERSLATFVEYGDLRGEGVARSLLGDVALQEGDLPTARDAYTRVLAIMQQVGDLREEGVARSKLGDVALQEGDLPTARDAYTRYLAIMQQVGDLREEGVARFKLATVLEALGEVDEAERLHRASLEIGIRVQSPPDVADSLAELGRFLIEHGRGIAEGRDMLRQAEVIYIRLGSAWAQQAEAARSLLGQMGGDDME
ncbi:MAG TPA: tetratricopeptide repeat protein, partial [Ktedonobacterales bacterium]